MAHRSIRSVCRWQNLLVLVAVVSSLLIGLCADGAVAATPEWSSSTTTARRREEQHVVIPDKVSTMNNDMEDDDDCMMICHITRVHAMFEQGLKIDDVASGNDDDNDTTTTTPGMYWCAITQQQKHRHLLELLLNQANEQAHGPAIHAGNFYACIPKAYVVQQSQPSDDSSSSNPSIVVVFPDNGPLLKGMTQMDMINRRRRRRLQNQEQSSQQQQQVTPPSSSFGESSALTAVSQQQPASTSTLLLYDVPPLPTTHAEMVQLRTGIKKMLVVRLVTTRGEQPDESLDEIQAAIFGTGPNSTSTTATSSNSSMNGAPSGVGVGASVVEQYAAASLGALQYQPLIGPGHENGVLQVTLDWQINGTGIQTITAAILNATATALGLPRRVVLNATNSSRPAASPATTNTSNSNSIPVPEEEVSMLASVYEVAHHTIFCLPSGSLLAGSPEWTAFTYLYEPYSYYQRGRCTALSVVMHEVGHALGFRHSGGDTSATSANANATTVGDSSSSNNDTSTTAADFGNIDNVAGVDFEDDLANNNPYSDETCYLGYSVFQKGMPRKSFNAHKNWISGWFPQERLVAINATSLLLQSPAAGAADLVLQSTETTKNATTTTLPITTITTGDDTATGSTTTTTSSSTGAQVVNSNLVPSAAPAVAVGRLVSHVDGTKTLESNDALLLQIETPRSMPDEDSSSNTTTTIVRTNAPPQYFYLQYNRAKGFNQDSAHPDTVTVVQANDEMQVSYLKAGLSTGQSYRVDIYGDSAATAAVAASMVVTVCSVGSNVMDDVDTLDYARVAIHVERHLPQEASASTSSFDPCQTGDNGFGRKDPSLPTTNGSVPTPAPIVTTSTTTLAPTSAPVQQPGEQNDDNTGDGEKPQDFFPDPSVPSSSNVQSEGDDEGSATEQRLFSLDTTAGRISIILSVMIVLVIVIATALVWACRRHVHVQRKLELERRAAERGARRPASSAAAAASSSQKSSPRQSSSPIPPPPPYKKLPSLSEAIVDLQIVEDPTDSTAEEDLTDASDDPLCLSERGSMIIASPPPPPRPPQPRSSGGSSSSASRSGSSSRGRRPLTPQERRRLQQLRQQQQYHHIIQSQRPQHSPYHHRGHRPSSSTSRRPSSTSSSRRRTSPALISPSRVGSSPGASTLSPPAFVDDLSMIEEDPLSLSESSRSSSNGADNDANSSGGGSEDLLQDITDRSDDPLVLDRTSSGLV